MPNAEVDIRSMPPNDANEIADNPVTVMVTLAPDATVAGAAIVGAPITMRVAFAISVGLVAVNRNVYVPAKTPVGNLKVRPADVPNDPELPTVTDVALSVTG